MIRIASIKQLDQFKIWCYYVCKGILFRTDRSRRSITCSELTSIFFVILCLLQKDCFQMKLLLQYSHQTHPTTIQIMHMKSGIFARMRGLPYWYKFFSLKSKRMGTTYTLAIDHMDLTKIRRDGRFWTAVCREVGSKGILRLQWS